MKLLYIIDGYSLIFRAYHSMPPLSSPSGYPVGAVYGFIQMLLSIREKHQIEVLSVVLDSGKKGYRHIMLEQYKANRKAPAEALKKQFNIVREALAAFNVSVIEQEGIEADDLIATYTMHALANNYAVTIISSDKDFFPLIHYEKVKIYDPMKSQYITSHYVQEKFGVLPRQMADMLALIGDSSDNIPGAHGIGVKSAAKLLCQYDSIDGIYNNLSNITPKRVRDALITNRSDVILSREVVRLQTDLPIQHNLQTMTVVDYDKDLLMAFLKKYGFQSIIKRLKLYAISTLKI